MDKDRTDALSFGSFDVLRKPDGNLDELGSGGFGRTYRARHRILGTEVALKVIHDRLSSDERARERFLREARALARLNHPSIVKIHDVADFNGTLFYAMELCEKGDLQALVARIGPVPTGEAFRLIRQAADALGCAHGAGLVHRDIKPSNILLVTDGDGRLKAKLIDFGLVRQIEHDPDAAMLTVDGQAQFTPAFASPEQLREKPAGPASDIFSLGMTLWFLLAGKRPIDGSPAEIIGERLSDVDYEARLPEDLTGTARQVLGRMLRKNPRERQDDCAALLREFDLCLRELPGAPESWHSGKGPTLSIRDRYLLEPPVAGQRWVAGRRLSTGEPVRVTMLAAEIPREEIDRLRLLHTRLEAAASRVLSRVIEVGEFEEGWAVVIEGFAGGANLEQAVRGDLPLELGRVALLLHRVAGAIDTALACRVPDIQVEGLCVMPDWGDIRQAGGADWNRARVKLPVDLWARPQDSGRQLSGTVDTASVDLPPTAAFAGLVYYMLGGKKLPLAAYFRAADYVFLPDLLEEANQKLRVLATASAGGTRDGCRACFHDILNAEGITLASLFAPLVEEGEQLKQAQSEQLAAAALAVKGGQEAAASHPTLAAEQSWLVDSLMALEHRVGAASPIDSGLLRALTSAEGLEGFLDGARNAVAEAQALATEAEKCRKEIVAATGRMDEQARHREEAIERVRLAREQVRSSIDAARSHRQGVEEWIAFAPASVAHQGAPLREAMETIEKLGPQIEALARQIATASPETLDDYARSATSLANRAIQSLHDLETGLSGFAVLVQAAGEQEERAAQLSLRCAQISDLIAQLLSQLASGVASAREMASGPGEAGLIDAAHDRGRQAARMASEALERTDPNPDEAESWLGRAEHHVEVLRATVSEAARMVEDAQAAGRARAAAAAAEAREALTNRVDEIKAAVQSAERARREMDGLTRKRPDLERFLIDVGRHKTVTSRCLKEAETELIALDQSVDSSSDALTGTLSQIEQLRDTAAQAAEAAEACRLRAAVEPLPAPRQPEARVEPVVAPPEPVPPAPEAIGPTETGTGESEPQEETRTNGAPTPSVSHPTPEEVTPPLVAALDDAAEGDLAIAPVTPALAAAAADSVTDSQRPDPEDDPDVVAFPLAHEESDSAPNQATPIPLPGREEESGLPEVWARLASQEGSGLGHPQGRTSPTELNDDLWPDNSLVSPEVLVPDSHCSIEADDTSEIPREEQAAGSPEPSAQPPAAPVRGLPIATKPPPIRDDTPTRLRKAYWVGAAAVLLLCGLVGAYWWLSAQPEAEVRDLTLEFAEWESDHKRFLAKDPNDPGLRFELEGKRAGSALRLELPNWRSRSAIIAPIGMATTAELSPHPETLTWPKDKLSVRLPAPTSWVKALAKHHIKPELSGEPPAGKIFHLNEQGEELALDASELTQLVARPRSEQPRLTVVLPRDSPVSLAGPVVWSMDGSDPWNPVWKVAMSFVAKQSLVLYHDKWCTPLFDRVLVGSEARPISFHLNPHSNRMEDTVRLSSDDEATLVKSAGAWRIIPEDAASPEYLRITNGVAEYMVPSLPDFEMPSIPQDNSLSPEDMATNLTKEFGYVISIRLDENTTKRTHLRRLVGVDGGDRFSRVLTATLDPWRDWLARANFLNSVYAGILKEKATWLPEMDKDVKLMEDITNSWKKLGDNPRLDEVRELVSKFSRKLENKTTLSILKMVDGRYVGNTSPSSSGDWRIELRLTELTIRSPGAYSLTMTGQNPAYKVIEASPKEDVSAWSIYTKLSSSDLELILSCEMDQHGASAWLLSMGGQLGARNIPVTVTASPGK